MKTKHFAASKEKDNPTAPVIEGLVDNGEKL